MLRPTGRTALDSEVEEDACGSNGIQQRGQPRSDAKSTALLKTTAWEKSCKGDSIKIQVLMRLKARGGVGEKSTIEAWHCE